MNVLLLLCSLLMDQVDAVCRFIFIYFCGCNESKSMVTDGILIVVALFLY